jgi:hypothetical protein
MIKTGKTHKALVLFVDHTKFLRQWREDVIMSGPHLPSIISPTKIPRAVMKLKLLLVHMLL